MKVSNFGKEHLFIFSTYSFLQAEKMLFCSTAMQCWTVPSVNIYLMTGGVALVE
jgi:hypothetical protein